MEIIFLRHGKAEERGIVSDHIRKLTSKGKKELIENLPYLAKYIQKKDFAVWSSSLIRAYETAEILLSSIDNSKPEIHPFISQGDNNALIKELENTTAQTVVIVGHEPFLSDWIFQLTGKSVIVKKGSAKSVEWNSDPAKSYLRWDASIDNMKKIQDMDKETFSQWIREASNLLIEQFKRKRTSFLSDITNPEGIHQLRISIRKLRTLISLNKSLIPKNVYVEIQDTLREKLGHSAHLREIDVVIDSVRPHIDKRKRNMLPALWEYLENERIAAVEELYPIVKSDEYENEIINAVHSIYEYTELANANIIIPKEYIEKIIKKWIKFFIKQIDDTDNMSLIEIHKMRLSAKKARYISEAFEQKINLKFRKIQHQAKSMQNLIGDICDCYNNIDILNKIKEDNPNNTTLSKEIDKFNSYLEDLAIKKRKKLKYK